MGCDVVNDGNRGDKYLSLIGDEDIIGKMRRVELAQLT